MLTYRRILRNPSPTSDPHPLFTPHHVLCTIMATRRVLIIVNVLTLATKRGTQHRKDHSGMTAPRASPDAFEDDNCYDDAWIAHFVYDGETASHQGIITSRSIESR